MEKSSKQHSEETENIDLKSERDSGESESKAYQLVRTEQYQLTVDEESRMSGVTALGN